MQNNNAIIYNWQIEGNMFHDIITPDMHKKQKSAIWMS